MPLFTLFIFGAVLLGAGTLFAPALPTTQPRIGAAAAFTLALIMGGALFWLNLFGGEMLVVDYVLFALLSGIVLGGTLSQAQMRAEALGKELPDAEQGWTGPEDLVFFALVGLLVIGALLIAKPYASDGTFAAGWELLTNYLSQQLSQARPAVQSGVAAVVAFLSVWSIYDLGSELRDKQLGRTMALVFLALPVYLLTQGSFATLLGVLFVTVYLIFALRVARYRQWRDTLIAGLMLGATLYAGSPALIVAVVASIPWLLWHVRGSSVKDVPPHQQMGALAGIPIVALLATLPTLLKHLQEPRTLRIYVGDGMMTPIGWIAASIVVALVVGWALLWLWETRVPAAARQTLHRRYYLVAGVAAVLLVVILFVIR
jgi:hypothetical protein